MFAITGKEITNPEIRMIRDGVRAGPYKMNSAGQKTVNSALDLKANTYAVQSSVEDLTKIANSKLVEFQIETIEVALKEDHLKALQKLIEKMPQ